jgi:hypothetical protein
MEDNNHEFETQCAAENVACHRCGVMKTPAHVQDAIDHVAYWAANNPESAWKSTMNDVRLLLLEVHRLQWFCGGE